MCNPLIINCVHCSEKRSSLDNNFIDKNMGLAAGAQVPVGQDAEILGQDADVARGHVDVDREVENVDGAVFGIDAMGQTALLHEFLAIGRRVILHPLGHHNPGGTVLQETG